MSAVTKQEIVEALRGPIGALGNAQRKELADRIEKHGIAYEPKCEEAIAPPRRRCPMNRDDVIRMGVECQLLTTSNRDGLYVQALERFAALVAAAEREQCAAVCDDREDWIADKLAAEIRALGNGGEK